MHYLRLIISSGCFSVSECVSICSTPSKIRSHTVITENALLQKFDVQYTENLMSNSMSNYVSSIQNIEFDNKISVSCTSNFTLRRKHYIELNKLLRLQNTRWNEEHSSVHMSMSVQLSIQCHVQVTFTNFNSITSNVSVTTFKWATQ